MKPIEFKGQKVVTTEMLAEKLNVDSILLTKNFNNNKKYYLEGEDYFLLKGAELKEFKNYIQIMDIVQINKRTPSLYLWTESGALNHAKSLQNEEAWNIFLNFRDQYFRQKEALRAIADVFEVNKPLLEHTKREVQVTNSKAINAYFWTNGTTLDIADYNRRSCELHSGYTPSQLKKIAKSMGLKSKQRTSGKEVLRNLRPEVAASMSLTDELVRHGGLLDEIAPMSVAAQPVISKLQQLILSGVKKI